MTNNIQTKRTFSEMYNFLDTFEDDLKESKIMLKLLKENLGKMEGQLTNLENTVTYIEQARDCIMLAVGATQTEVCGFIEDLVTLALQSVFGPEYGFCLKLSEKRGQLEIEPIILWQNDKFSPRTDVGGGVIDVVSFAMRIVLWALTNNKTNPTFILDEPFKHLSSEYVEAASSMLRKVSSLLKVQIIMVSHNTMLTAAADMHYAVTRSGKGIATVERKK